MKHRVQWLMLGIGLLGILPTAWAHVRIADPYEEVVWGTFGRHKANLHMHSRRHKILEEGAAVYVTGEVRSETGARLKTAERGYNLRNPHPRFEAASGRPGGSDGSGRPDEMIDAYRALGYTLLALTDHNMVTWPWTAYGRDPATLGLFAIMGNEISGHHHLGSYFNDYDGEHRQEEESLLAIGARDGLAVLFHPGRYAYDVAWYTNLFHRFDHLVGLEVVNGPDRYPDDRALWDRILTSMPPDRPVWGYANDDAHNARHHVGRSWQVFLLPEVSEAAVRRAMTRGHFYFCHAEEPGQAAPVIHSIRAEEEKGTIAIEAEGWTGIRWISAGEVIARDTATLDVTTLRGYVRAELVGPAGISFTQPFFIRGTDP